MTCRRLDVTVTWSDVQEMDEFTVEVWDAFAGGEAHGRHTQTAGR